MPGRTSSARLVGAGSGTTLDALRSWGAYLVVMFLTCLDVARERRQLARLDERALKDFGVGRADAERESARGFWDVSRRPRRR
jgi:hypothetical protein